MDICGNPTMAETKYRSDVTELVTSTCTNTATDALRIIGLPLTLQTVSYIYNNYGHPIEEVISYGRAYRESLPFKGSVASSWNTTSFDNYDRPTGVTYASGKASTTNYSGNNVTIIDNGVSTTHYYDAQGNLTSVSDPAGTIIRPKFKTAI